MRALHASRGFVMPLVLGIILLVALFAVHAATELGSTALLANQRLLHQRAFEAAEAGIVAALDQLQAGTGPATLQQLQSGRFPSDSATVRSTQTAQISPIGFSAGRVLETQYELRSTGHSVRAAAVTIAQGVRQLQAAPSP